MTDLTDFEIVQDDTDLTDLLVRPAGALQEAGPLLSWDAFDTAFDRWLEEAVAGHFDEKEHPRWPKGSGERSGRFMRVGEHFNRGGKEYEITHVLGGKVWAREASGKNVETITVDTKKMAGFDAHHPSQVTVPAEHVEHTLPTSTATMMSGGKAGADITVVDADARDAGPHDPSIPLPKDSSFTAEEWAGFGRLDQLHYAELQGHFGKWDPSRAKAEIKAIAEKADDTVLRYFNECVSRQYGSSTGWTMTMASAFHNVGSMVNDLFTKGKITSPSAQQEEKKRLREEAKVLAAQHQAVIHWDLYNRVRAPEVTVFHRSKSATGPWDWEKFMSGKEAVFPGISTSWNFGASGLKQFGPRGVAFPMAVRHTLMSSYSAQPVYQKSSGGSVSVEEHFPGEYEIASPFKLRFDPKRVQWFDESEWQKKGQQNTQKWLVGQTKAPAGPEVWQALKEHQDGIAALPPAPAPAEIEMVHQAQTWLTPPQEAFDKIDDRKLSLANSEELQIGDVFSAHGVAYKVDSITGGQVHGVKIISSSSTPLQAQAPTEATVKVGEGVGIARPVSDMGVKPGDFVMGQAGTRYLIIADPGEPHLGLRYMQANGTSYPLYTNEDRRFFTLEGHVTLPGAVAEEGEPFNPHNYVNSGDKKFVGDMATGDKFTVAGNAYEVTKQMGYGKAGIKLLSTGALGTINTDYQTPYLIPADAKMKAKIKAEPAKHTEPPKPSAAAFGDIGVGDHFAHMGAILEKTSPGKAKVVALQPGSGLTANFIGSEQSFAPDTAIDGPASAPAAPAHHVGQPFVMDDYAPGSAQVSQKNLDVGSIHLAPSTGAPLKLVAKDGPGGDYTWENLATGEKSYFLPHSVKVTQLAKKAATTPLDSEPQAPHVTPALVTSDDPMAHPDAAEGGFAGYKYHKSATKTYPYVSLMPVGTVFKDAQGKHWQVKQPGPVPIVTDGEKLYHVPKGGRGLVMDYHELPGGDKSPPLKPEAPYVPEHAGGTMLPNTEKHSLGALPAYGVGPGNTIDVAGKHYLIVSAHGQTGWIYTTNTATGKPKVFAPGTIPDGFSKEKQAVPESAAPSAGAPEGEGLGGMADHNPDDFVSGFPLALSELGPGQKFVDANGVHGAYVGAEPDGAASVDVLSGPFAGTQTVMAGNAPVHTLVPKTIVANAPGEPEPPPEPSAVLGNLSVGTKITMHDDGTVTFDGPSSVVYHGNAGTLIDTNGVSHLLSPDTPVSEPTPAEQAADYQFDVAHFEVGPWKKLKDMEVGEHFKAVKTHTPQKVIAQDPDAGTTTIESKGNEYVVSHNKSRETWIKKASAPANATHIIPPPGATPAPAAPEVTQDPPTPDDTPSAGEPQPEAEAPAAPAPAKSPQPIDKTPGTAIKAASDLAVGDHFAVKENPHYAMQVTKVEGDQVTYKVPNGNSYTTPHEDLDDLVWAQAVTGTPDTPGKPSTPSAEQTAAPAESPPFKWNAHVAGPRMKVQKMPVGTLYHDNQGGVYRVTGHEGGKTQIVQVYSVYSQHIGKTYDVASNHSSPTVVPFEKPDLSGTTLGDKQPLNAQPVGSIVDFNGTPLRVLHHGTKKTTVKDASKPGWTTMELHGSFPVRPHLVADDGGSAPLAPEVPHAPAGHLPPTGAAQTSGPMPNVIQGYKFHKSATKKYPFIGKVAVGSTVQDAAGKQFVVLSHEGGQTIYRDSAGLQYVADAKTRVWVIEAVQEAAEAAETPADAPPGLIEGFLSRWAFAGFLAHEPLAVLREGCAFSTPAGLEYRLGALLADDRALVHGSDGSFTVPAGTLVERTAA